MKRSRWTVLSLLAAAHALNAPAALVAFVFGAGAFGWTGLYLARAGVDVALARIAPLAKRA